MSADVLRDIQYSVSQSDQLSLKSNLEILDKADWLVSHYEVTSTAWNW